MKEDLEIYKFFADLSSGAWQEAGKRTTGGRERISVGAFQA